MLTLSPVTIIGTIINLLVLYFLLQHFLFKPIQKIMDQREELIRGQLKDARDQRNPPESSKTSMRRRSLRQRRSPGRSWSGPEKKRHSRRRQS